MSLHSAIPSRQRKVKRSGSSCGFAARQPRTVEMDRNGQTGVRARNRHRYFGLTRVRASGACGCGRSRLDSESYATADRYIQQLS